MGTSQPSPQVQNHGGHGGWVGKASRFRSDLARWPESQAVNLQLHSLKRKSFHILITLFCAPKPQVLQALLLKARQKGRPNYGIRICILTIPPGDRPLLEILEALCQENLNSVMLALLKNRLASPLSPLSPLPPLNTLPLEGPSFLGFTFLTPVFPLSPSLLSCLFCQFSLCLSHLSNFFAIVHCRV